MAEMTSYAIELQAMTQSRGSFTFHFVRYEDCPPTAQQKAIDEAKALQEGNYSVSKTTAVWHHPHRCPFLREKTCGKAGFHRIPSSYRTGNKMGFRRRTSGKNADQPASVALEGRRAVELEYHKILVFLWPLNHWRQAKQQCGIIPHRCFPLEYLQPVLQLA